MLIEIIKVVCSISFKKTENLVKGLATGTSCNRAKNNLYRNRRETRLEFLPSFNWRCLAKVNETSAWLSSVRRATLLVLIEQVVEEWRVIGFSPCKWSSFISNIVFSNPICWSFFLSNTAFSKWSFFLRNNVLKNCSFFLSNTVFQRFVRVLQNKRKEAQRKDGIAFFPS